MPSNLFKLQLFWQLWHLTVSICDNDVPNIETLDNVLQFNFSCYMFFKKTPLSVKKKPVKLVSYKRKFWNQKRCPHTTGVCLKLTEVQKEGMCRDAAEKRPSRNIYKSRWLLLDCTFKITPCASGNFIGPWCIKSTKDAKIIHGMHPVGRKVQSIDLKMFL